MSLILHYHPLSSYCQKVLIALYELGVPFEPRLLDLGDATQREAFRALWPTGKMPVLEDRGQVVAESSILIEHLALSQGTAQSLVPADAQAALEVRLWDRLSDLYVMTPMQAAVAERLRPPAERDVLASDKAATTLQMAYSLIERQLAKDPRRSWLAGDGFTMADCAAAPALFYARTIVAIPASHAALNAYFERLLLRPSVARVLSEAKPWLAHYPVRERLEQRFLD